MPCYDGRENERQVLVTYEHEARIRKDCRHNSDVAELLCALLRQMPLRERGLHLAFNIPLATWWREHQARDRARQDNVKKISKRR